MSFEDLSPFFAGLDVTDAVFQLESGNITVPGYFDNAFFNTQIGETVMDTTAPRFTCPASLVAAIPNQCPVTINGALYSVNQIQPEGTGLSTIQLAIEPNNL